MPDNPLPRRPSPIIGRERDIADLVQAVPDVPIVTLVGPAGCGKTRLALEAGHRLSDAFEDGRIWVELAGLFDGSRLTETLAEALAVNPSRGTTPYDAVRDALATQSVLVILDNCEHVLAEVRALLMRLLAECPHLRVLATSREPLGAPDERVQALSPLDPPAEGITLEGLEANAAVRLFATRAAEVIPGFALTPENASTVAAICRRLDGLPLAIELAAARARVLSPAQIAARLDDALQLLTRQHPSARSSHPTLRATLAWSDRLLSPEQRTVFHALSVFAGSFTPDMVEAVVDDALQTTVLDTLDDLVNHSLVVAVERQSEGHRFRVLDTVRQYARERLVADDAQADVHQRWLAWAVTLTETAAPELKKAQQKTWLQRLALDQDNLRVALRWALETRAWDLGLRLAAALENFWWGHGQMAEGLDWLERFLAPHGQDEGDASPEHLATAQLAAGVLAYRQGEYERARLWLERSLHYRRAEGDRAGSARILNNLGNIALDTGDFSAASDLYREALTIRRALNDVNGTASVLNNLAFAHFNLGLYADADATYEESLSLYWEVGDLWSIASCLNNLGETARRRGQFERAQTLLGESLELRRELGDARGVALVDHNLASLAVSRGEWAQAALLLKRSLAVLVEGGHRVNIVGCVETVVALEALQGDPRRAVRLDAFAQAWRRSLGMPVPPLDATQQETQRAGLQQAVGEEAFDALSTTGRALTSKHVLAEVNAIEIAPSPETGPAMSGVAPLQVCTLGQTRVWVAERELADADWVYAKSKELFFYLLLHPRVKKERLGLDLWPEASPSQLRSTFHRTLHHTRKALGRPEWIGFAGDLYLLALPPDALIDAHLFEDALERVSAILEAGHLAEAGALLEQALAHYQGDFLVEAPFGDWAQVERARLQRRAFAARLLLGQLLFRQERYSEAVAAFRALITVDPYAEIGHRELIRTLSRMGEAGQAVRHYQSLQKLLAEELDTVPAPETTELFERLRRGDLL